MDTKNEIREFLTSRRGRVTPEQAGLPSYGARRVPGLRREEVAVLAGVSVPYYTRLERGDMNGVSDGVLEGLARALQLDDAERAHLLDLARAADPMPARPRRRAAKHGIRPELQWILDAITGAAAFVSNDRLDLLAANQLARALYSELYDAPARPVNTARFVFLDPRADVTYPEWDRVATETVAILRSAAGRDPYNRELTDLVGVNDHRNSPVVITGIPQVRWSVLWRRRAAGGSRAQTGSPVVLRPARSWASLARWPRMR